MMYYMRQLETRFKKWTFKLKFFDLILTKIRQKGHPLFQISQRFFSHITNFGSHSIRLDEIKSKNEFLKKIYNFWHF